MNGLFHTRAGVRLVARVDRSEAATHRGGLDVLQTRLKELLDEPVGVQQVVLAASDLLQD